MGLSPGGQRADSPGEPADVAWRGLSAAVQAGRAAYVGHRTDSKTALPQGPHITNLTDSSTFRRSHSILVVDDNVAMKYSVARLLRAQGYNTVEAASGAEALELSEFVSAVVLDVHLPDVDGFEVCRILRTRPATALLPIIHFSVDRIEEADAVAAIECGADGFLVAPLDSAELTRTLDRLLHSRGVIDDSAGARSGAGAGSILHQMTKHERGKGG